MVVWIPSQGTGVCHALFENIKNREFVFSNIKKIHLGWWRVAKMLSIF